VVLDTKVAQAKNKATPTTNSTDVILATDLVAPEEPEEPEEPDEPEGVVAEAVLVGDAVATAPTPPVTGPLSLSVVSPLPIFFAAASKVEKVLLPDVGALMDPTIPCPQWRGVLQ